MLLELYDRRRVEISSRASLDRHWLDDRTSHYLWRPRRRFWQGGTGLVRIARQGNVREEEARRPKSSCFDAVWQLIATAAGAALIVQHRGGTSQNGSVLARSGGGRGTQLGTIGRTLRRVAKLETLSIGISNARAARNN